MAQPVPFQLFSFSAFQLFSFSAFQHFMKVAIASSGLGHVSRGIETWALDTAKALAGNGVDVTLFSGAGCPAFAKATAGMRVSGVACRVVPCLRRYGGMARWLATLSPGWAWRWGLKNPYGWEQWSFWRGLRRELIRGGFDILHVQDPMVAYWCNRARRQGKVTAKEILAHGTEESPEFLGRFDYVQHLAPWHLQQAASVAGASRVASRVSGEHWTAIPNFVDTDVFRPARDATEKAACRRELGVPEGAFVLGTAAAVKKSHKRIDYLIREFADFLATRDTPFPAYLLIAGARQADTDELVALARELADDRIRILLDVPRDKMPEFYRSLDLFVLASLFEMMPIAVLEALASGVPLVTNRHPVLEWMAGEGGEAIDISLEGALSSRLRGVDVDWLRSRSAKARSRALACFNRQVVIERYVDYYGEVMNA